ncbi:MAG: penicillin acylase family protein, partial [Gammaproteobacteria bacterium]
QLQDIITIWDGRATIDSAGYRMVREFRRQTHDELLSHILQDCGNAEEPIVLNRMNQTEGPLWRLVSEQPSHLLPNIYRNWDHFLLTMADAATASCSHASLAACTWGEINTVLITHPLAKPLPFLSPWLYIHNGPLPGGDYTPRYQRQANGASERFAVSPGKEAEGYFHMPGGQSGHPLSSFYRAGHSAWVRGEPLPFLPGETKHILTLNP